MLKRMGRHGKNATASAVYSYHERKKDTGDLIIRYIYSGIFLRLEKIPSL